QTGRRLAGTSGCPKRHMWMTLRRAQGSSRPTGSGSRGAAGWYAGARTATALRPLCRDCPECPAGAGPRGAAYAEDSDHRPTDAETGVDVPQAHVRRLALVVQEIDPADGAHDAAGPAVGAAVQQGRGALAGQLLGQLAA